jgi:hypothetical protein
MGSKATLDLKFAPGPHRGEANFKSVAFGGTPSGIGGRAKRPPGFVLSCGGKSEATGGSCGSPLCAPRLAQRRGFRRQPNCRVILEIYRISGTLSMTIFGQISILSNISEFSLQESLRSAQHNMRRERGDNFRGNEGCAVRDRPRVTASVVKTAAFERIWQPRSLKPAAIVRKSTARQKTPAEVRC